jgi:hypothetical protein
MRGVPRDSGLVASIQKRLRAGEYVGPISKATGVSEATVRFYANEAGIDYARRHKGKTGPVRLPKAPTGYRSPLIVRDMVAAKRALSRWY